jgi:hypothetical protein
MLVEDELLVKIKNLYVDYQSCDDIEEFLFSSRRKLKILVDSLWEQLVLKFLDKHPRNAREALRILNIYCANQEIDPINRPIVQSLVSMLENYRVLDDKTYIDFSEDLIKIMDNHFYHLIYNLCDHAEQSQSGQAMALKRTIAE